MQSTANACLSHGTPPPPRTSNVDFTQDQQERDALLRQMGTELLFTSLIGASINLTTGDYSRGASGFRIENDESAWPVNECTIAGDLSDILLAITPANNARPPLSTPVPSLLIQGLNIAGE